MEAQNGDNEVILSDLVDVEKFGSRMDGGNGVDNYKRFLTHPVLLHNITWSAAGFADSVVTSDLIAFYFNGMPITMKNKVENLYYVRGIFRLRIVVQGASQAGGQLVVCAFPLPKYSRPDGYNYADPYTKTNMRIVPHCVVDPSMSQTYEIDLPVCTVTGYYPVAKAGTQTYGSYALFTSVFSGLISGTAVSPTVNISIYGSFVDPTYSGMRAAIGLGPDLAEESTPAGTLSTIIEKASGASAILKKAPYIGAYATLFSDFSSGVSQVLKKLGYSKPSALVNSLFITNRSADNYSQTDGTSTALVLGKSQSQGLAISPAWMAGKMDDMLISKICATPGYYTRFVVPTSTSAGSALGFLRVHPVLSSGTSDIALTPLGGVAAAHLHWKGDITFTFEIVATVFHRATFMIAWDPSGALAPSPVPLAYLTALATLQNTIVYVSGNTTVDITIPYTQPRPASLCLPDWEDPANYEDPYGRAYNGCIYLYMVNPITSNGSTDSLVINVFARSENIKFSLPHTYHLPKVTRYVNASPALMAEEEEEILPVEGLGPLMDFVPATSISFGPASNLDGLEGELFGDVSYSVKDLVCRMCNTTQVPSKPLNMTTLALSATTEIPYAGSNPEIYRNFLNWFNPAFLGARGSMRGTLVDVQGGSGTFIVTHELMGTQVNPSWHNPSNSVSEFGPGDYAFTQINKRISAGIDVAIPMVVDVDFLPMRNFRTFGNTDVSAKPMVQVRGFLASEDTAIWPVGRLKWFLGAGDDYTLGWFLGFPKVGLS